MSTALVLFRRDLRLLDNPALSAACDSHERVLPVYILDPGQDGEWAPGAASRWWLHHSLASLQAALHGHHSGLHLARGETLATLQKLIADTGADAVYWNRLYEPASIAHDTLLKKALLEQGTAVHTCNSTLWVEPWKITTQQGEPYRVFTPFWRNLRAQLTPVEPLPTPALHGWKPIAGSLELSALKLLPTIAWDAGLTERWHPGEHGANEMVELFCDDAVSDYAQARDLPARHGTSRLSPHLHHGEISPRQIHAGLLENNKRQPAKRRADIEPYLRELGWREFSHHLLYHFPKTPTENFNPRFANFRWNDPDKALLASWQRGRTGIPLVDAGMRELWHTGWMHNRVRMIVASFLTKNLRQHWYEGERWFWNTLVDADLANNTLGWQWVAGCGADAAPYFRIFNPVTQSKKFDPDGVYLRRWLPEIADFPVGLLHEPWKDPERSERAGYPAPIVDLGQSREDALAAYQAIKA